MSRLLPLYALAWVVFGRTWVLAFVAGIVLTAFIFAGPARGTSVTAMDPAKDGVTDARGSSHPSSGQASPLATVDDAPASVPPSLTTPARDDPAPSTVALITAAALEFGVDPARLVAVAQCESSLNGLAVGRDQEIGLMQFQPRTFAANAPALGYTIRDIVDDRAQARVAAFMFSAGRASAWTCAR